MVRPTGSVVVIGILAGEEPTTTTLPVGLTIGTTTGPVPR
jgi:hypothetical protein